MCEKCEYVCDTPLGSYCTLTCESIETTAYKMMKEVSR